MSLLFKRLLLLVLGMAIASLLVEIGLRVGGVVFRETADRSSIAREGGTTILCIGDSHTYGVGVDPDQSYPAWLEKHLRTFDPSAGYQVVNLGIPGMNSAQAVDELDDWLDIYEPDLVVVWVGLNNLWNRADPAGIHTDERSPWRRWISGLRLFRLYTTLRTQSFLRALESAGDAGVEAVSEGANAWLFSEQRSEGEMFDVTLRDHGFMAEMLGERGIPFVLVGYPRDAGPVESHRTAVTTVGKTLGVPVVDTRRAVERARRANPAARMMCTLEESHRRACLFHNGMGPHATGLLNGLISKEIGLEVTRTLASGRDRPSP